MLVNALLNELVLINFKSAHLIITENNSFAV